MSFIRTAGQQETLTAIWRDLHWPLIGCVMVLGLTGVAILYSVAGESFSPWAWRHGLRLVLGLGLMLAVASIEARTLLNAAYPVYIVILLLLIGVVLLGETSMGATRWLDLGIIRLQPSEFMKLGLVMALARYYQNLHQGDVSLVQNLILPLLIIAMPALLIFRQPDLGTMLVMVLTGLSVMFMAGVSWRLFVGGGVALLAAVPVIWQNLHNYQKERVLVFLDPERDPLGGGYHVIQSKIGIGSGGFLGKGFGEGTQSRLNFLPEKHTDFVFTIFAEEFGFVGCLLVLVAFAIMLFFIFSIANIARNPFSRLTIMGIGVSLFVYMAVNLAMVTGLAPVVGLPLPFMSYGGTSLLTFMLSIGVILSLERQIYSDLPRG